MPNLRRALFPYGMSKNPDGSWTLFGRDYRPVGVVAGDRGDLDDPKHKVKLKFVGQSVLARLDIRSEGTGNRIYFYDDGTTPELSKPAMDAYLEKLAIIMRIQAAPPLKEQE